MGCLYQLVFPDGKSYIGITSKTAKQRFKEHCLNSRNGITEYPNYSPEEKAESDRKYGFDNFGKLPWLTALGGAIRKYGDGTIVVKTLVISNNIEYLKELEIKAIKQYRTLYRPFSRYSGYNTSKGNCPKEIDYVVQTKKWRLTITPSFPWPPKFFSEEAKFVADFDSLTEAKIIREEIRREEVRRWLEYTKRLSTESRETI
ncbi:MAG TPA: GIY-YIG nuclease family protein [Sideroxyarcus sp.]|nr:GIY-YIG nuclease family protein [Sideroxyarcus sp.]